jgi:hypothetical protein
MSLNDFNALMVYRMAPLFMWRLVVDFSNCDTTQYSILKLLNIDS